MYIDESDYLAHYGILRKSGRYPWGSGGNEMGDQLPRNMNFNDHVNHLKKQGISEKEIANGFGMTMNDMRRRQTIIVQEERQAKILRAQRLRDEGKSNTAIGKAMGVNESVVRGWLKPGELEKTQVIESTAKVLRDSVADKTYVDVGSGVENHLGITQTKLATAVSKLQDEGYEVLPVNIPQLGTDKETRMKVLCPPGTTQKTLWEHRHEIEQITNYSEDGGKTFSTAKYTPIAVNPRRVDVLYSEDGGGQADGVIYVRRGVPDVQLGMKNYAQVRIQVGDGHYLKGMAMYKDDLPEGIDLQFNTNKSNTGNKFDAMKPLGTDADLPFGSIVRPIKADVGTPKERVISAMNIVNEEGDWAGWSKTLSSQMLSKQNPAIAKTQLNLKYEESLKDFQDIQKLTNPTIRRLLMDKFAESTDSSAVHLEAAALSSRQGYHAILPIASMPATQVYAPNFLDGERVVLIRFPHAGPFEIPELTVNNNHPEAKRLLGSNPVDAIGIHHSVAERLSGADFDGDTVLVIPNNQGKVKTHPALEDLKGFEPKIQYREYPGMHRMTSREKGMEMGKISNLITDMTLQNASTSDIAHAVKHSMVVIDAEKHYLNYKQSAIDNKIPALMEKYQGSKAGRPATLISRSTSSKKILDRKPRPVGEGGAIDVNTGELKFVPTGKVDFRTKNPKTTKSTRGAETTDAHTLSSGTPMENLYADHANKLKGLANQARLESFKTPHAKQSPSAKKVYSKEVASLNDQLDVALRNRPLERQAQVIGNALVKIKRDANPNMDEATLKKVKAQSLNTARIRTGAGKTLITITDKEWEAIQAGAISESKLELQIFPNANLDRIRELATPKERKLMTSSKTTRARTMFAQGYTRAEVANALGVSLSTLDESVKVGIED